MNVLIGIGLTALVVALLGYTGANDYEDALASEAAYCARVVAGEHTDYLAIREVCNERY